jgi:ATP-binding cassette subfamily B protein
VSAAPPAPRGAAPGETTRERAARTSALEAMHEEEALGKAYDGRLLARLWPFVRPYRGQVALAIALVVPLFLFELAPAWSSRRPRPRARRRPAARTWGAAAGCARGAVAPLPQGSRRCTACGALRRVALAPPRSLLDSYVLSLTGQGAMRDLRHTVFTHIQRLHLGFFDRYPVGRLVTRATNDIENVAEMFSAGIVVAVTDLAKMLGIAAALFLVDARLALSTFLVVPVMALLTAIFRLKVREAYRLIRVRIARINAYTQENEGGMKEVQLFTREARTLREFERMNAEHRDAWLQSIRYDLGALRWWSWRRT